MFKTPHTNLLLYVQINLVETAWLISRMNNALAIDALSVSISQRTVKIGWAFLNSQRWMNT